MSTVYRSMLTDGTVPEDVLLQVQKQSMTDDAALHGKQLLDIALVFDGTVAEAIADPEVLQHAPEIVAHQGNPTLRVIIHSAEAVS